MLKLLKYLLMPLLLFAACESVYQPELDEVESVLAVEARLVYGKPPYQIILQKSAGFNSSDNFEPYTNALVQLLDSRENGYLAVQTQPGVYQLTDALDSTEHYRLHIIAGGDTYLSGAETVPPAPEISAIYNEESEKWSQPGGETDVEEFIKTKGQQLFVDIDNENNEKYYRFTARKILQYYFPFDTIMYGMEMVENKYCWKSYYPQDLFNIAGPAEYSSEVDILKHPVEYFRYDAEALLDTTQRSAGWIYIMYQYGISKSAYRFYNDLNTQLGAEGKIFDPMYVQARSNLKCISNAKKVVLGNFEITSFREHRFFVKPDPFHGSHIVRKINVFHNIPESGIVPLYPPWFWER